MIPLWFHSKAVIRRGAQVVLLIVGLIWGMASMSYGQSLRPCGPPQRPDAALAGLTENALSSKKRVLEFIPSLCVSERYDSNVTLTPTAQHDYVTHVAPRVLVKHDSEYVSGTFDASGFNETYARDSNLNFFGGAGALSLNFDKALKQLLPNASFGITEAARYTPLPPSFLNPVAGTSPSDPINPQDAFARGILAFRTKNFVNNAGANFSYVISPRTSMTLSYSNAIVRYGDSDVNQNIRGALFDTTTHTGTISGFVSLTPSDTLNSRYTYSDSTFSSQTTATSGGTVTSGINSSFQSHSPLVGWTRRVTSYLTSDIRGGVIIVNSNVGSGLISWAVDAALTITDPNYPVTVSFSRTAFPSVFGQATPVIGNTVSLSASQNLGRDWQLAESANFSQSTGATTANDSGVDRLRFTTYRGAIDLYYWVTRIWSVALSYDYLKFDSEFGRNSSQFDRHAVTLGVKATWE